MLFKPDQPTRLSLRTLCAWSLIAGLLIPLALAPLNIWPLAFFSPALLAWCMYRQNRQRVMIMAFCFGLGMFAVGTSWVFVSIHQFGNASIPLASMLTALFVVFLAAIFCLPFALISRKNTVAASTHLVLFSCLWVIGEWIRSWLFTGFPWLFIGYSQLQTPLAGWAPVGGIYAVSLATLLSACTLSLFLISKRKTEKIVATVIIASLWISGAAFTQANWTQIQGLTRKVALVQPNIPQRMKWQQDFIQPSLSRLRSQSANAASADWIIWPEAAIPLLYHQALPFLESINQQASQRQNALITGILYDDPKTKTYYNSLTGFGMATGIYHKKRLVPFGEYVPMENTLRGLIDFFNLPMSMITAGPEQQPGIQIGAYNVASAICYEIVYPDLVAHNARNSAAIITVSNDAWFGHSWGPLQHLQMAQMRALETGRYVLRATNNGVSAIITAKGKIQIASEQFVQSVIQGEIEIMAGNTPFMSLGSRPTILLCLIALAIVSGIHSFANRKLTCP